ncbi:hypothetical protein [Ectobacillus sp. sgz5001026]|uniref:hypothetical protein n=1 Tax=Ectobacillus sp. sgz5001026 TaxID=3242473 RepID=UPI0036D3C224
MKRKFLPSTFLGKWSIGLLSTFFLLLALGTIVAQVQGPIEDQTFFNNLAVTIPMVIGLTAGVCAFLIGMISIFKKKERSIFVFLVTFIGLMLLIFLMGEVLVPH